MPPVAVIGFSLKFSASVHCTVGGELLEILKAKRSAQSDIPADRYNIGGLYHPDAERHDTVSILRPKRLFFRARI